MSAREPHDLYYRRLELGPGASHDEIVHAYRRLAHLTHPDAHPADPAAPRRFRELTEAYEILADPARRDRYDRTQWTGPAVRVVVRPARPTSSYPPLHRATPGQDSLFASGATRPAGAPLRAGPVRIEPSGERPGEDRRAPRDVALAQVSQLLSEMLDSLWRW